MDAQQLEELIERYISDRCTPEDIRLLRQELMTEGKEELLSAIMDRQLAENRSGEEDFDGLVKRVTAEITNRIGRQETETQVVDLRPRQAFAWRRWAAAAAVLVLLAGVFYVWQAGRSVPGPAISSNEEQLPAVIEPGKDGAILTLADGSTMVLDSLGNGVVTTQNGSRVLLKNGELTYHAPASGPAGEAAINTITTPKGRQFRLQLEDGTRVWLNAASSLRYPAVFTGVHRVVEVTGEAYFEVAKDKSRPFHVKLNSETEIEVLGTQFNVNSYANEASINTTLVEGSVQINSRAGKTKISPGQQAQVFNGSDGEVKVVDRVDMDRVTAWKSGVFNFDNASLKDVMRQLERWYDIEVEYDSGVQNFEFLGKMGRDLSLQDVLRGLEMSGVHFKIIGNKKIVVTP